MPFKMSPSNFSALTFFFLFATSMCGCNQTSKHSDNKVDTVTNATTDFTHRNTSNDSLINTSAVEEKIIDTIFKLPEVNARAKYIRRQTNGKRHLKIWVESTPKSPNQDYYWIKVGEDNGTSLVTHFNFYVFPDSIRVMYHDVETDSTMTLDRWRKINGM